MNTYRICKIDEYLSNDRKHAQDDLITMCKNETLNNATIKAFLSYSFYWYYRLSLLLDPWIYPEGSYKFMLVRLCVFVSLILSGTGVAWNLLITFFLKFGTVIFNHNFFEKMVRTEF